MAAGPAVLVIEDDAETARVIRAALEPEGYRVLQAVGEAGLYVAQREQPAVILLDADTPGLGLGVDEIVRRLRADPRTAHIPIIAMSSEYGRGDDGDDVWCDETRSCRAVSAAVIGREATRDS